MAILRFDNEVYNTLTNIGEVKITRKEFSEKYEDQLGILYNYFIELYEDMCNDDTIDDYPDDEE